MPTDEENKKEEPIRGLPRLLRTIGVTFQDDTPKLDKVDNIELNNYSQTELRHLPGFDVPEEQRKAYQSGISQLQSYLRTIAQSSGEWSDEIKAIKILTPEIDRSAEIMVSSIMSPTDIQTDTVNVVCKDTDLGEEVEGKITETVSKFFNETLDLGNKTYKYIKQALYEDGSAAILVLPQSNIKTLNRAADVDWFKGGKGELLKKNFKELTAADHITTHDKSVPSVETLCPESSAASCEAIIADKLAQSLESHNIFDSGKMPISEIIAASKPAREEILKLFNENKQSIVISRDVTRINERERTLQEKIEQMQAEVDKNFIFDKMNPTYLLNDSYDEERKENPAVIEIPPRAVIPITIPGSPEKHIGYFVMLDSWGAPLFGVASDNVKQYGPRRLTEAATQSAFGVPSMYRFSSAIDDSQRYELTSTIFGLTLKQLLDNKLEDYGLLGATIEENDAITTCIFRQILMQRKCTLVFVPEPMMVYLRFDHRENGTGKAITENLSTLLALRTVLIMSYIMAATENSVNNKTITVAVDEKQTNIQQYLEMIRNAYVSKKMMRFDVNPLTVQQDLIQKSLTILPKGVKGISDALDVQTEHRQTGAVAPDDGLLEKINEWIVTALQVPHSALNQLSENEYSRSVASTNLYFSNNVKSKQKVVEKYMTKFIKLYAKYSYAIQSKIADIIVKSDKSAKDRESSEALPKSDVKVQMNDEKSVHKRVRLAIDNLKIILPSPRIVVDKTQYAEIEQYIQTIEKICETLYHDEMLSGDAQDLQDTMKIMRACIREKMVREYIKKIGFQSIYEMPMPEDIDMDKAMELIKLLSNKRKGVSDWMKQIAAKSSSEDSMDTTGGGGYGDASGAGGGDMGGGAGGGGDFDMGMGEGNMSGGGEAGGGAGGEAGGAAGGTDAGGAEATNGTPAPNDFSKVQTPPQF